jgi:hypothetical protein
MGRGVAWASPFLLVVAAFLAYTAVKRRWNLAWILFFGVLANSTILWVVALVVASVYGREDLFVPFVLAMISSVFTGVALRVRVDSLVKRMGDQIRAPRFHPSYILTGTVTVSLFGGLFLFAKIEHVDRRSVVVMAMPLAAIALACYLFERSQYRSQKRGN